jgi:drug/metabolite transporter (DMT)-like permease
MLAVLLALAAAACLGGSDYTAGLAARKGGVLRVTVAAQVTSAVLLLSVVPFVSRQAPSAPTVAWGVAAGASGVAGITLLTLGFRYAAFSLVSPVSAVAAAGFSVLAGLLLGERPGGLALAGIALTVPAIVAVSAGGARQASGAPDESHATVAPAAPLPAGGPGGPGGPGADGPRVAGAPGHRTAGIVCGLAAGAGFGGALICLNRAGSVTDLWPVGVAGLTAVVLAVCMAALAGELRLPPAGTRRLCLLTGVVAATGSMSYFLATHRGLLAVTAVIYSLYPAGTIVLARVVSGEHLTAVRISGLLLAAASVGLIAAGTVG